MRHLARKAALVPLAGAAIYLALCAYLYAEQDSLALPGASLGLPAQERPGVETVWLTLSDGTRLRGGRAVPPAGEKAAEGSVIYYGGNAEDATAILPALARATGRVAIAYNYRGFAGSEGEPSLERFEGDAIEVYRHVSRNGSPVAIVGRSVGTGAALAAAAAAGEELAHLSLVSPYDSLGEVAARAMPFFPVRTLLAHDIDGAALAARVVAPTTVAIATDDAEVPADRSRALIAALPAAPQVIELPGVGHNELLGQPAVWDAVVSASRGE